MKITKYDTQTSGTEVQSVTLYIEFETKDGLPDLKERLTHKFFENAFQDRLKWWPHATIILGGKGGKLTIERKMLRARGWLTDKEQICIDFIYAVVYPILRDSLNTAKKRFAKQAKK